MAGKTNFKAVEVTAITRKDGKTIPAGTPATALSDVSAAGAIAASSNDADGAKLADVQALRTTVNSLVTQVNALKAAQVTFGERASS